MTAAARPLAEQVEEGVAALIAGGGLRLVAAVEAVQGRPAGAPAEAPQSSKLS